MKKTIHGREKLSMKNTRMYGVPSGSKNCPKCGVTISANKETCKGCS